MNSFIKINNCGICCEPGGFYIDPWKPVDKALITHGHSDHARWGCKSYLSVKESKGIICSRLGEDINIQTVSYGEELNVNGVKVSFHPAGHILGSAQIRVEYKGEIVVFSGDYKVDPDKTTPAFEPVKCHTFVTESTFGLPIYQWDEPQKVFDSMNNWWRTNKEAGKTSIVFCYALGKAQRIISGLDTSIGSIYTHGTVENMNAIYRREKVNLPPTTHVNAIEKKIDWSSSIVIAPPSANGTPWLRKFGNVSTAFISGWMMIRGARRRRAVDRGFVLSDHADWDGLIRAIKSTGAENVWVTHGYTNIFSRYLGENGYNTGILPTHYEGELESEV
jgi:putative mRNA 3-end processing factor